MGFQPGANIYTQGFGSRAENLEVPHIDVRSPGSTDIYYPVGKRWINQTLSTEFTLINFTTQPATSGIPPTLIPNWVSQSSTTSGTFTPTISGLTTSGVQTYTTQIGMYTRIGNIIFIIIEIVLASATGTGIVVINGLPFTVNSMVDLVPASIDSMNFFIATATAITPVFFGGSTTMRIYGYIPNTGNSVNSALESNQTASFRISGFYQT